MSIARSGLDWCVRLPNMPKWSEIELAQSICSSKLCFNIASLYVSDEVAAASIYFTSMKSHMEGRAIASRGNHSFYFLTDVPEHQLMRHHAALWRAMGLLRQATLPTTHCHIKVATIVLMRRISKHDYNSEITLKLPITLQEINTLRMSQPLYRLHSILRAGINKKVTLSLSYTFIGPYSRSKVTINVSREITSLFLTTVQTHIIA